MDRTAPRSANANTALPATTSQASAIARPVGEGNGVIDHA